LKHTFGDVSDEPPQRAPYTKRKELGLSCDLSSATHAAAAALALRQTTHESHDDAYKTKPNPALNLYSPQVTTLLALTHPHAEYRVRQAAAVEYERAVERRKTTGSSEEEGVGGGGGARYTHKI
jgi:hypothetical protein